MTVFLYVRMYTVYLKNIHISYLDQTGQRRNVSHSVTFHLHKWYFYQLNQNHNITLNFCDINFNIITLFTTHVQVIHFLQIFPVKILDAFLVVPKTDVGQDS
jgi:hypothetical protein